MPDLNLEETTQSDLNRWGKFLSAKIDDDTTKEDAAKAILIKAEGFEFESLSTSKGLQEFLKANGYDEKGVPPKWVKTAAKADKSNGATHEGKEAEGGEKKAKGGSKKAKGEGAEDGDEGGGDSTEVVPVKLGKEQKAQIKALFEKLGDVRKKGLDSLSEDWVNFTMDQGEIVGQIKDIAGQGNMIQQVEEYGSKMKPAVTYRELEDLRRIHVLFNDKRELIKGLNPTKARALLTAPDPVKAAQKGLPNPDPENGPRTLKIQDHEVTADQIRGAIRAQVVEGGGETSKRGKKVSYRVFINWFAKPEKNWARAKQFFAQSLKEEKAPNSKEKKALAALGQKIEAIKEFIDKANEL